MEEKKSMKSLWTENFAPEPIAITNPPSEADFNKAWNWMLERDSAGEFIRAGLALLVVHSHSLNLRRKGVQESAKMAAVAVFKRYTTSTVIPVRKTQIKALPKRGINPDTTACQKPSLPKRAFQP